MKSINLSRNGHTINITESGEAIVAGRKYKVDVDFATGKVELTYMCEDDGTLSADIAFDNISFFADKKTTPNTSTGKKPTISGVKCLLDNDSDCFRCLTEDEKAVIETIEVKRDDKDVSDIDSLLTIAESSIYATLETIRARVATGETMLDIALRDGEDTHYLTIVHNSIGADEIDVEFSVGNSILNQMYSYIVTQITEVVAGGLDSIAFYNTSTIENQNFLDGLDAGILNSKNITIYSDKVEEAVLMMQILRYAISPDNITVDVDDGNILSVVKVGESYELSINSNKEGDDVVETLMYLYKAFMSITSIDSLEEVHTYDEEGNIVATQYVDTTDYSYDDIETYAGHGFISKGYWITKKFTIKYVCDGYGTDFFCELGDEISKFEEINYVG